MEDGQKTFWRECETHMIPKRPGPLGVGVIIVLVLSWVDNVLSPAVERCKITYQHL